MRRGEVMLIRPAPGAWAADAKCLGMNPAMFTPSTLTGVKAAQRVCAECPVRVECAEHGIRWEAFGVWGGLSERQRRQIRRERRLDGKAGA